MAPDTIVSIISSVGFPIVTALICFWYINKINEDHKAESKDFAEAINRNTSVMEKLLEKFNEKEGF